jgi:Ca2+-binding RTX toxin-like protein
MSTQSPQPSTLAAPVGFSALTSSPSQPGILNGTFSFTIPDRFTAAPNAVVTGSFHFSDATVDPNLGFQAIPLDSLEVNLLAPDFSATFSLVDALGPATADFFNGVFSGIDYDVADASAPSNGGVSPLLAFVINRDTFAVADFNGDIADGLVGYSPLSDTPPIGGLELIGTPGNDSLVGTAGADLISGLGGDDLITAGSGNDTVNGDIGDDQILGGGGNDIITGGDGIDVIFGDDGPGSGSFGSRNDQISGGRGKDRIFGEAGNDQINGDDGDDNLDGGEGFDIISGDNGRDRIFGSSGDDQLFGNTGNDQLNGDTGFDALDGGDGNDRLTGADLSNSQFGLGAGEVDTLTGGIGSDTFILGDATWVYYDDRESTTSGDSDYALITDFSASRDFVQLKGSADFYSFDFFTNSAGVLSAGLIYDPGVVPRGELIAIFENAAPTLRITAPAFRFV